MAWAADRLAWTDDFEPAPELVRFPVDSVPWEAIGPGDFGPLPELVRAFSTGWGGPELVRDLVPRSLSDREPSEATKLDVLSGTLFSSARMWRMNGEFGCSVPALVILTLSPAISSGF